MDDRRPFRSREGIACLRVSLTVGSQRIANRGTGTLISPDLMLTALHVLTAKPGMEPEDTTTVTAEFESDKRECSIEEWDVADDWAVLRLDAPVTKEQPWGVSACALGPATDVWPEFATFGFPAAKETDGTWYKGRVLSLESYSNRPAVKVLSDELRQHADRQGESYAEGSPGAHSVEGLSGAPLIVEGQIHGIIRFQFTDLRGGALFATPISVVTAPAVVELRRLGLELTTGRLAPTWRVPPARLLDAAYAIVPFGGRERELQLLDDWLAADEPCSVWLWHGPGGAGKTRLAAEWIARVRASSNAEAGFVQQVDDALLRRVSSPVPHPVVLVVDYAESTPRLAALVEAFAALSDGTKCRARLLLLARNAAGWWDHLSEGGRGSGVVDLLRRKEPYELVPELTGGDLRGAELQRAFHAMRSAVLQHECVPADQELPTEVRLPEDVDRDPRYGRPLYVHAHALAQLLAPATAEIPATGDLLHAILRHEESFWRRYNDRGGASSDGDRAFCSQVRDALGIVTLMGAMSAAALKQMEARLHRPVRTALMDELLADIYTQPGRVGRSIGPLAPDLLGETLVLRLMEEQGVEWVAGLAEHATPAQLEHAFTVIGRIEIDLFGGAADASGGSRERGERDGTIVERAFAAMLSPSPPQERIVAAFDAALTLGGRSATSGLGAAIHDRLRQLPDDDARRTAIALLPRLPEQTVSLADLAVWVQRTLLRSHDGNEAQRVVLLNDLALRLGIAGQVDEAVEHARECVAVARRLGDPEGERILPLLSISLHTLTNQLIRADRDAEALEVSREGLQLARSLEKQGRLSKGRLANTIAAHGMALQKTGALSSALSTIDDALITLKKCGAADPSSSDVGSYVAALATCSDILHQLDRDDRALVLAERALEIDRLRAADRPDRHLPDLANSLVRWATAVRGVKEHDKAIAAVQEAVAIYRNLVASRPMFREGLTQAQDTLAGCFYLAGRPAEAWEALQAPLAAYRADVDMDDPSTLRRFSGRCMDAAKILLSLQRVEDALRLTEEGVVAQRRVRELESDGAAVVRLARGLVWCAEYQMALGRLRPAVVSCREALAELKTADSSQLTEALLVECGEVLNHTGAMLSNAGEPAEAVAVLKQAIELRRRIAGGSPTRGRDLAISQLNLGITYSRMGDLSAAAAALAEAGAELQGLHSAGDAVATSLAKQLFQQDMLVRMRASERNVVLPPPSTAMLLLMAEIGPALLADM